MATESKQLSTAVLRAASSFLDSLLPARSADKSLGSVVPWSSYSSVVFFPHVEIRATLLHFSAVIQGKQKSEHYLKFQLLNMLLIRILLVVCSLGWDEELTLLHRSLMALTDSKRRCILDLIFLFSKTEGIPMDQEKVYCLMCFLTHEIHQDLKNKCYSGISITCQR